MENRFKIRVTKNGPYIVSGGVPLTEQLICVDPDGQCTGWREEKTYPVRESYALCRCGGSRTRPFCDGTHTKIAFDGTETAGRGRYLDRARSIEGPDVVLTDAPDLCAAAGFCQRASGIWELIGKANDPRARIICLQEAWDCPSGRLIIWDKGGKAIEPDWPPSIDLVLDPEAGLMGPIWVRGGIPIESADGTIYEIRNRVTLCRCGKSTNKPFCNGAHLG